MTTKEKATELINKFDPLVYPYLGSGFMTNTEDEGVILKNAKRCALIAVDEIIIEVEQIVSISNYWRNVKEEIKNYDTRTTV